MQAYAREAIVDLAGPLGGGLYSASSPAYGTALHEASHAVALRVLHRPVFRVSVIPDSVSRGRVFLSEAGERMHELEATAPGRYRLTDTRQALIALAVQGFKGRALRREFRRFQRVSRSFVALYYRPIRTLAEALMITPELDSAACDAIIRRALCRLDHGRLPA